MALRTALPCPRYTRVRTSLEPLWLAEAWARQQACTPATVKRRGIAVRTSAKVTSATVVSDGVRLEIVAANKTESLTVEKLLVATGRDHAGPGCHRRG